MVSRLAISPAIPAITNEFTVSNALIGASLTGMWLAYALVQYPSGILAKKYGERRIILASITGAGLTSLMLATAPRFEIFFVGTVALGAAAGLHFSVATTLISRAFDTLGTPIAIHNAGGPAAGLIMPAAVSWIVVRYGWRPAIGTSVLITAVAYVSFSKYIRPTVPVRSNTTIREQLQLRSLVSDLSRPPIAFTGIVAILAEFAWTGLISFLPTFLSAYRGYSSTTAGILFGAYFVALGTLQVGIGSLSDQYGRNVSTGLCMIAGIVGISLLISVPGLTVAAAGTVLLGFGMGWGAAVFPQFMDHLSESEQGTGFGLIRTAYLIVASTGSVTLGFLADQFGWAVSFATLIAALGIVLCLIVVNWARDWGF